MTPRIRSLLAALAIATAAPTFTVAAPRFAHSRSFVTIPAGTTLHVRLAQPIHVDSTRRGATYHAVLDRSVWMRRAVVIPSGASVRLRTVGVNRTRRSDRLLLTANAVSFGGRTYRISTSDVQARGRREFRGTTGTTGVLAGRGTVERVRISPNTRFQFRLMNGVTVRRY
jgi:hypothetical protein